MMKVAHTPCSRNRKPGLALPQGASAHPPQPSRRLRQRRPRSHRCHLTHPCLDCGALPTTQIEHPSHSHTERKLALQAGVTLGKRRLILLAPCFTVVLLQCAWTCRRAYWGGGNWGVVTRESLLSFHRVGPTYQTGVVRLGSKCLYLMTHFNGPVSSSCRRGAEARMGGGSNGNDAVTISRKELEPGQRTRSSGP